MRRPALPTSFLSDGKIYQRAIDRWENEGGAAPGDRATAGIGFPMEPDARAAITKPIHAVKQDPQSVVLTVGHSTRPLDEFIALLAAHRVTYLIDVRTVPRSRHNPQFNRDTLPDALEHEGIHYTHEAGLGGFRRANPESPNRGWRNASFRGYADYMQTAEFASHLASLMKLSEKERVALMCAEAVPWRCHRSLIADALLVHDFRVEEIINQAQSRIHALTPFAKVNGTGITYPSPDTTDSVHSDNH